MENIITYLQGFGINLDGGVVIMNVFLVGIIMTIINNSCRKSKKKMMGFRLMISPVTAMLLTVMYHINGLSEAFSGMILWTGLCNAIFSTGAYKMVKDVMNKKFGLQIGVIEKKSKK